jgi:hypothetical protein
MKTLAARHFRPNHFAFQGLVGKNAPDDLLSTILVWVIYRRGENAVGDLLAR